ncbi:MAG TPA: glycosyltransferase family 2 protein [Candidatus Tectomicrobia bacterium]|nr:glycosyltransferase family 2 protein [Candidatus Tectomicrobia bacterium]
MTGTRIALSVALCTCDGERFLPAQLDSIAAQTRLPDELVVHDDRSTDASVAIVRDFAARAPFPVRVTVNATRFGSTANFEAALADARGDIIALCDQDDVWRPDKLARIESAFETSPDALCVFSDAQIVGEHLEPLGYRLWDSVGFDGPPQQRMAAGGGVDVLLRQNVVTGATLALRSDLRDLALPIPPGWVHDGWVGLLAAAVGVCLPLPEPLVRYRQHGRQQIGAPRPTLRRQIATARRMDAAFLAALADAYEAAAERLRRSTTYRCPQHVLRKIDEKVAHCRARARIRARRWRHVRCLLRELRTRRYRRYSLGWKSAASDLFL